MAFQAFVPAAPLDAESSAADGSLSEESEAEDSEPDSSGVALSTRPHLVPSALSFVVSFWNGRGVEPWRSAPDPRPGERS